MWRAGGEELAWSIASTSRSLTRSAVMPSYFAVGRYTPPPSRCQCEQPAKPHARAPPPPPTQESEMEWPGALPMPDAVPMRPGAVPTRVYIGRGQKRAGEALFSKCRSPKGGDRYGLVGDLGLELLLKVGDLHSQVAHHGLLGLHLRRSGTSEKKFRRGCLDCRCCSQATHYRHLDKVDASEWARGAG